MDVQLTHGQRAFVQQAIATGRLSREEDAVQEALALWEERERTRAEILRKVDRAEASLANGEGRTLLDRPTLRMTLTVARNIAYPIQAKRRQRELAVQAAEVQATPTSSATADRCGDETWGTRPFCKRGKEDGDNGGDSRGDNCNCRIPECVRHLAIILSPSQCCPLIAVKFLKSHSIVDSGGNP